MTAYFWNGFRKDKNSTARPDVTTANIEDVLLIDNTDIVYPTISLQAAFNPTGFNFAYLPDFNRYYVINGWKYYGGLWYADLVCDFLATWKTEIGNSTQYVLRSSKEFEGTVIDNLLPLKTRPYVENVWPEIGTNPFSSLIENGTFIVGIFNRDANAYGAVSYYAFTQQEFRNFCNFLMSDTFISQMGVSAAEVSSDLLKALYNPLQYIASCKWFPFSLLVPGAEITNIPFGYWSVSAHCHRPLRLTANNSIYLSGIPHHPQSLTHGYYTRTAPYTRYRLVWEAFGTFDIPPEALYDGAEIRIDVNTDLITGEGVLTVRPVNTLTQQYEPLATHPVTIGIDIAMSQLTRDTAGAGASVLSSAASLFTGNVIGAASGIASAVNNISPTLSVMGINGGPAKYLLAPQLVCEFRYLADNDINRLGRPLCSPRKISTLAADNTQSGYVLCSNVEMELPGLAIDAQEVKARMEAGFFYA